MSTISGSYSVSQFSTNLGAEIRRLDAQVDLFWSVEKPLLEKHGLKDGMNLLDCGCGPGRLLELISNAFRGTSLTGLEIDPILVDVCRQRFADRGDTQVLVQQGSAESPGLPEQSFDFITMRLVLEHVPDPVVALTSLAKLLKPGGRLAIISNDFSYHLRTWPEVAELEDLYRAYRQSRRHDGGDPCIGRRLPALLQQAGLSVTGFDVEVAHSRQVGDDAFFAAEGVGIPAQLVESGFLDQELFEAMIRNWKRMLADPNHCIMRPLFIAAAEQRDRSHTHMQDETPTHKNDTPKFAPSCSNDDCPPSNQLEDQIAQLWAEAMEVPQVGIRSNFFDLGGDSLMLEELQVMIADKLDTHVPMAVLFQYPTVEQLAAYIAEKTSDQDSGDASGQESSGEQIPSRQNGSKRPATDQLESNAQKRRRALSNKRMRRPNSNGSD